MTYSPRDPAGLTVLGYMLYSNGEDERAREIVAFLQRLPKNENDDFAKFLVEQLDRRKSPDKSAK